MGALPRSAWSLRLTLPISKIISARKFGWGRPGCVGASSKEDEEKRGDQRSFAAFWLVGVEAREGLPAHGAK